MQMAALGVAPLVALVQSGSAAAKEQAAGALGNLGLVQQNRSAIVNSGGYQALSQLVIHGTAAQREVAAAALQVLAHADEMAIVVRKG